MGTRRRTFPCSALCCLLFAAVLLVGTSKLGFCSSEAAFKKQCAKLKAVDITSGQQLEQARAAYPGRPLQISGSIQGLMTSGDTSIFIVTFPDGGTAEVRTKSDHEEIQTGARVRCLVKASTNRRLSFDLLDITWDRTPLDVLTQSARAALKIPPRNKAEITAAQDDIARRQAAAAGTQAASLPSRAGDQSLTCRRAIAALNPRLKSSDVNLIADSIVGYCSRYGVDPYLVVAVIATESRFNPNARSYKGAAGLGQLMPATAAAHGVNPYDPVANLDVAIRIIRRNLDKYNGDPLRALAAYNAGNGAVKRYGGVPPYRETRDYLWRIYNYLCWLRGETPVARPK